MVALAGCDELRLYALQQEPPTFPFRELVVSGGTARMDFDDCAGRPRTVEHPGSGADAYGTWVARTAAAFPTDAAFQARRSADGTTLRAWFSVRDATGYEDWQATELGVATVAGARSGVLAEALASTLPLFPWCRR